MTRSPTSSAASPRSTKRPKAKARSGPADKKPTRRHKPAASAELLGCLAFDRTGLIPAIAQQFDTGEVLMVAWMNRAALEETLRTGAVCYWSRSRKTLWRKGETSGQVQRLVELRVDCDQDVLLLQVDQAGVACHTGRRSCFFTALRNGKIETIAPVVTHPEKLYGD